MTTTHWFAIAPDGFPLLNGDKLKTTAGQFIFIGFKAPQDGKPGFITVKAENGEYIQDTGAQWGIRFQSETED